MSDDPTGTGGGDTPPAEGSPEALQIEIDKLLASRGDLEKQLAESQKRSSGKDKTVTTKTKDLDDALAKLGTMESTTAAELAQKESQIKELLGAGKTLAAALVENKTSIDGLAAEKAKLEGEVSRLTAVAEAGIDPDLVQFVPSTADEEELKKSISALKAVEERIVAQTKADMAKFGAAPGGAPPPTGDPTSIDLEKEFEGARSTEELLELAKKAAEKIQKLGLSDDGESWAAHTRIAMED